MKRTIITRLVLTTVLLVSSLGLKGCGTQTGNGLVTLEFASYSGTAWYSLIKPAYAAVSSATFCFKRLRFKTENEGTSSNPSQDSDNLDFAIGEITISPSGTALGSVQLPKGTYTRIEFDLEKDCTSAKSVQVSNTSGNFSTNDRVTVKFEGTFTMGDSAAKVSLGVQSIVSALDTVTSDSEIKNKLEAASGTF